MSGETALDTFRTIPDTMLWKGAALRQIEKVEQLAGGLGFPWAVVGHHTSKSIELPVIRISCGGVEVYIRDNFHDINVCVVAEEPLTAPLSALFDGILMPRDWEWYLEQVSRCRGYSWKEWTDEQMDDPEMLSLSDDAPSYRVKGPDQKARWLNRMTDPAWYNEDWSSGVVTWEGGFGPGAALWVQSHPFLEGISSIVPATATGPYKPGCKGFAVALGSLEQAKGLIKKFTDVDEVLP